ncbi:MAG TPA: universal stress protein [Caldilineaceae bacterium]|nr:universal stress protein [Caldilineaceae bacterium]
MEQHKVLILIDGSEYSLLILHYIKTFLAPETHAITLFCVKEDSLLLHPVHVAPTEMVENSQQVRSAVTEELVTELTPHQQALEAAGFATTLEVRFGDPVAEIDKFLDENRFDLIAMTTHGRTGLRRVLLGSVAQHLIQQSALPILLYRPFGYE